MLVSISPELFSFNRNVKVVFSASVFPVQNLPTRPYKFLTVLINDLSPKSIKVNGKTSLSF